MQGMEGGHLSCKVVLRHRPEISIADGSLGKTLHCHSNVSGLQHAVKRLAEPESTLLPQRAAAVHDSAALKGRLASPTAKVSTQDASTMSYICHPAVSDNSMHIGILTGKSDGLVRIPGEPDLRGSKRITIPFVT